jgi:hypothetical protein
MTVCLSNVVLEKTRTLVKQRAQQFFLGTLVTAERSEEYRHLRGMWGIGFAALRMTVLPGFPAAPQGTRSATGVAS